MLEVWVVPAVAAVVPGAAEVVQPAVEPAEAEEPAVEQVAVVVLESRPPEVAAEPMAEGVDLPVQQLVAALCRFAPRMAWAARVVPA